MAFNFFLRKKKAEVPVIEEPEKKANLIDADKLLMQLDLMTQTYNGVANSRSGKGEPRGYRRALKDITEMVRDMKGAEA